MVLYRVKYFFLFITMVVALVIVSKPSKSQLGVMYFTSYRYQDAYDVLKNESIKDIDNIIVLKRLKDYFVLQGDVKKALEFQNQLAALRPKNIEYLKELEKLYDWNQKPLGRLMTMVKRAELLELKERNELLNEAGNGFRWFKKFKLANDAFGKIKDTDDLGIMINMSQYYLATKQKQKAISLLEKVTKTEQIPIKFREKLAQVYYLNDDFKLAIVQYKILFHKKNEPKVIKSNIKFIGKNKKYIFENLDRIETIIELHLRLYETSKALEIRKYLYEMFIDRASFRYAYANLLFESGSKEEALPILRTLEDVQTSREFYQYELAQRYRELELFEDSIMRYKECIRISPTTRVYYYELAQVYEQINDKRKALEIYYELLKLEEKSAMMQMMRANMMASNSTIMNDFSNGILLAQNDITNEQKQKIRDLKLKISDLHEELHETDKAIEVLEGIEVKSGDVEVKKKLSERYLWSGKVGKSAEYAKEILKKEPENQQAIYSMLEFYLTNRNFEQAKTYYLKLSDDFKLNKKLSYLSIGEELFYQTKSFDMHRETCEEYHETFKELDFKNDEQVNLEIKCLKRRGNKRAAIEVLEEASELNPDNPKFITEVIYLYLDEKMIDEARDQIELLKEKSLYTKENNEQEKYLVELYWDWKERNSWSVNGLLRKVDFGPYSYMDYVFGLNKFSNGEMFYGVEYSKTTFDEGRDGSYDLVSPYFGIVQNFKGRKYNISAKYDFVSGDKPVANIPLNFDIEGAPIDNSYMSIQYRNSQTDIGGGNVANTNHISKMTFETYFRYVFDAIQSLDSDVMFNEFQFENEKGRQISFFAEYLRKVPDYLDLSYGARSNLTRFKESGNAASLKSLYVAKSFANYVVGQYQILYNIKDNQLLEFTFKPAVGFDLDRKINPGKLNNIFTRLRYVPKLDTNLILSYDYLSESSVQSEGSVKTLTLEFKYLF